jgi:hypothetical protein
MSSPPAARELQLLRRELDEAKLSLAQSRAEASAHQDAAAAAVRPLQLRECVLRAGVGNVTTLARGCVMERESWCTDAN